MPLKQYILIFSFLYLASNSIKNSLGFSLNEHLVFDNTDTNYLLVNTTNDTSSIHVKKEFNHGIVNEHLMPSEDYTTFYNHSQSTHNQYTGNTANLKHLFIILLKGVFFVLICLTCILGNILVVISVFTYRPLQNVQNIFIVSLAIADLFVAVFCMPFHMIFQLKNGKWIFGSIICQFFLTSDIMLCTASILHLCFIALDRYWAIKDSIKYAQKRTLNRVIFMIAIIWILSALVSLPGIIWNTKSSGLFPVNSVQNHASNNILNLHDQLSNEPEIRYEFICDISKDKSYRFISSCGTFFIPLVIMTFVYVRIFTETKRRLGERVKAAKKLANSIANSSTTSIRKSRKNKSKKAKQTSSSHMTKIDTQAKTEKCVEANEFDNSVQNQILIEDEKKNLDEDTDLIANIDIINKKRSIKYSNKKRVSIATNISISLSIKDGCEKEQSNTKDLTDINKNDSDASLSEQKSDNCISQQTSKMPLVQESKTTQTAQIAAKKSTTDEMQWTRNMNTGHTLQQRQKISLTRERRAARTLGIIMGVFTICWAPFFVVYLLESFGFKFSDTLVLFLTWLGYVNSCLNPIIYTIFNLDFRKSFKRLIFDCILCKKNF